MACSPIGTKQPMAILEVKNMAIKPNEVGAIDLSAGQDPPVDPPTPPAKPADGEDNGGGAPPAGGGDGKGAGETPQLIKVGDKFYTAEQIEEMGKDSKNYRELLPEFTRRSQRLSELESGKGQKEQKPEDTPFYMVEGWQPKSYEELQKALVLATQIGEKKAIARLEEMQTRQEEAKTIVDNFVAETKKSDREFDEDDFFTYVQRHKIPIKETSDLSSAYSQYKEVRDTKAKLPRVPEKKPADGVGAPADGKGTGFHVPMSQLRASGSVQDAAADALSKLKK